MDDEKKLLSVYNIIVADERHFYSTLITNIRLFWSIVTVTIGGIWIGAMNLSKPLNYKILGVVLVVGGIVIFFEMKLAVITNFRTYKRLLESIAIRASVEKKMGLTQNYSNKSEIDSYWSQSSIIPENQIEYRERFKTSKEFIDYTLWKSSKLGNPFSTGSIFTESTKWFNFVKYLGVILLVIGIYFCIFL